MKTTIKSSLVILFSRFVFFLCTCNLIVACSPQKTDTTSSTPSQQILIDDLNSKQKLWLESGAVDYSFSIHKECNCPDNIIPPINVNVAAQSSEVAQHKINNRRRQSSQTNRSLFNAPKNMEQYFNELRQAILLGKIRNVTYNFQYGFPSVITIRQSADNQLQQSLVHVRNFTMARTQQVAKLVNLSGILTNDAALSRYWLVVDNGQWYELKFNPVLLTTVLNIVYGTQIQVHGVLQYTGNDAQILIEVSQILTGNTQNNGLTLSGNFAFYLSPGNNNYNYYLIEKSGNAIALDLPNTLQTNVINLNGQKITITGQWNLTQTRFIVSQIDVSSYTPIEKIGRLRLSPSVLPNSPNQYLFVESNGLANVIRFPEALLYEAHRLYSSQAQVRVTGFLVQRLNEVFIESQQITELANTLFNVQTIGFIIEQGISFPGSQYKMLKLQTDTGTVAYIEIDPARFRLSDLNLIGARIQIAGEWLQNNYNGQFYIAVSQLNILSMPQSPSINLSGYIIEAGILGDLANCNSQLMRYKLLNDNGRVIDLQLDITTQIIGATAPGNNFQIGDRVIVGGFQQNNTSFQVQTVQISASSSIPYENRRVIAGTINAVYDSCAPTAKIAIFQADNNQFINLAIPTTVNFLYSGSLENGKRAQFSGLFSTDNSAAIVTDMTVLSHQPQRNIQGTISYVQVSNNTIKSIQLSLDDGASVEVEVFTPGTQIQDNVSLTPGSRIRVVGADLPTGLPRFAAHQVYIADPSLPLDPVSNTSITSMQIVNDNVQFIIKHPGRFYIGANDWFLRIGTELFLGIIMPGDSTILIVNVPKLTLDAISNGSSMSLSYGPDDARQLNLGALNKYLITQSRSNTQN